MNELQQAFSRSGGVEEKMCSERILELDYAKKKSFFGVVLNWKNLDDQTQYHLQQK